MILYDLDIWREKMKYLKMFYDNMYHTLTPITLSPLKVLQNRYINVTHVAYLIAEQHVQSIRPHVKLYVIFGHETEHVIGLGIHQLNRKTQCRHLQCKEEEWLEISLFCPVSNTFDS